MGDFQIAQMMAAPPNSYVITNEASYTYVDRVACLAVLNATEKGRVIDSRITTIPFGEINVDASDIYHANQRLIFAEDDETAKNVFLNTIKNSCIFCKAEWQESGEQGISHGYEINHPPGCRGAN